MSPRDGHVGYLEWSALALLVTGAKILNPSSILLTQYGKEATWILSSIAGLVNLGFLLLALRFMRNDPGQGFLQVVEKRAGKWISKWYALILFVGISMNGFINLRLLVDQAKIVTLPRTPISIMLLLSLAISMYLCYRGIETLARLSRVLLPWMLGGIISVAFLMFNRYNYNLLAPWLGPGLPKVLLDGTKHALYYGETFALTVLGMLVRRQKDFEKGLLRGTIIAVFAATLVILEVQLILGTPGSERVAFPFLELTRMIYLNRFVQHLEGVYSAIWLLIAFTQIAIDLYLATYLYTILFGMQRFRPMLLPMASLFMMLALLPRYFYQTIEWKDMYLIQVGGGLVYGTFILVWITSLVRGMQRSS